MSSNYKSFKRTGTVNIQPYLFYYYSEANASEFFFENMEEIFPYYYMHSDVTVLNHLLHKGMLPVMNESTV